MNIDEYRALVAQENVQNSSSEEQTNVQTTETPTATSEQTQETPSQSEPTSITDGAEGETQTEPSESKPFTLDIDGAEVDADELKNGYLRQRDYTQKTQELAKQRREIESLLQLKTKLDTNPELANQLAQELEIPTLNPVIQRQVMMEQELADLKLEREIDSLQSKYEDFDTKAVLEFAYQRGYDNLEDAYLMVKATNPTPAPVVDVESLKASLREELLSELKAQTTPVDTGSIISTNGGNAPIRDTSPTLSEAEMSIARKMGLSPEEYAKWRD